MVDICEHNLADHLIDALSTVLELALIPAVSLPHDLVSQALTFLLNRLCEVMLECELNTETAFR